MQIIKLFISDFIYAATLVVSKRMGRYTFRAKLETISFCHLVMLWNCTHIIVCVEFGNRIINLTQSNFYISLLQTEVDIIEDIDEYQTWPGWLIIVFRTLIMVWFLYELRTTMLYEHNTQKLNFLLHFGASSLVWFIYLPIIALIALHVSALWRFKLLLGITYSADCFAYCMMAHLLWPTRSEQYFLLAGSSAAELEELDEFNEAPHIVNSSYTSLSSMSSLDICRFDDPPKSKINT